MVLLNMECESQFLHQMGSSHNLVREHIVILKTMQAFKCFPWTENWQKCEITKVISDSLYAEQEY